MEEDEIPPSPPPPEMLRRHDGELLPDGRVAMAADDWQQIMEFQANTVMGIFNLQKEMGHDAVNAALVKLFKDAGQPQDFQSRRKEAMRTPGFLGSAAAVRRELAQIYRESYAAGPEAGAFYTRLTWMLDCLARATAAQQKLERTLNGRAEKAGQSEG